MTSKEHGNKVSGNSWNFLTKNSSEKQENINQVFLKKFKNKIIKKIAIIFIYFKKNVQ